MMRTKQLIYVALFAGLTAVGAFLRIPLGLSYFTLQFFFTAMAGVLLGARLGALSQCLYVLLGLAGLPVFTQGGGIFYLVNPTCGFLFGLAAAAYVIGRLTRGRRPGFWRIGLACLAGLVVLYAIGLPYLYLILTLHMGREVSAWYVVQTGMLLFLPGDVLKIAVTALLGKRLLPLLRLGTGEKGLDKGA